jgi:hypothetical protein
VRRLAEGSQRAKTPAKTQTMQTAPQAMQSPDSGHISIERFEYVLHEQCDDCIIEMATAIDKEIVRRGQSDQSERMFS